MTNSGFNPGKINIDWGIWRVISEGLATLQEIETHWSVDDLADANECLDIKAEAEQYSANRQRRGK